MYQADQHLIYLDKTWGTSPGLGIHLIMKELSDGWFRSWGVIESNNTNAGVGLSNRPFSNRLYLPEHNLKKEATLPPIYLPMEQVLRGRNDNPFLTNVSSLIGH